MQEYYYANYRVLMDESVAAREAERNLSEFTSPMPYTHTFRVREGDRRDADARLAWARGCPLVTDGILYNTHDTGDGWAFASTPEGERRTMNWIHKLVLCSRDYSDITVYAACGEDGSGVPNTLRNAADLLHLAVSAGIDRNDGLALHASMAGKDGCGVVFLGPSGMGKSTQAKLWETILGADYLSEDCPCLRRIGGKWVGFGMPWWSRDVFRQNSVPVRAFVRLSKAKENRIEPMDPLQAMAELLRQFRLPVWDRVTMDTVTAKLAELAQEMPFYHLYCLPDEEAVRLTYETIFKG